VDNAGNWGSSDHYKVLIEYLICYWTLTISGEGNSNPSPGSYSHDCGSDISVTAIETDSCWEFSYWELDGSNVGSSNPYIFHVSNATLNAVFVLKTYDLSVELSGTGDTDPSPGIYTHNCGSDVSVRAIETDWDFSHWMLDGENAGSVNPYTVTMNSSHQLIAVFIYMPCNLTLKVSGVGITSPSLGIHQYDCDVFVSVTAIETDPCWKFSHWLLDGSNIVSANPTTIYMGNDHEMVAEFRQLVIVDTNCTVTDMEVDLTAREIRFNVSALTGTIGFFNVTINYNESGIMPPYTVIVDAEQVEFNVKYDNGTHYCIYFELQFSTHNVIIIPEIHGAFILFLLLILASASVIFSKRRGQRDKHALEILGDGS
jgi:hypothetical protein